MKRGPKPYRCVSCRRKSAIEAGSICEKCFQREADRPPEPKRYRKMREALFRKA